MLSDSEVMDTMLRCFGDGRDCKSCAYKKSRENYHCCGTLIHDASFVTWNTIRKYENSTGLKISSAEREIINSIDLCALDSTCDTCRYFATNLKSLNVLAVDINGIWKKYKR